MGITQNTDGSFKSEDEPFMKVKPSEGQMRRNLVALYSGTSVYLPAVSLGNFFDGQTDLVAEVSASIHDSKRAFSQNHPLSVLIVLIVVLWRRATSRR